MQIIGSQSLSRLGLMTKISCRVREVSDLVQKSCLYLPTTLCEAGFSLQSLSPSACSKI